jgi:GNAT superfamily N-acetyltransferase
MASVWVATAQDVVMCAAIVADLSDFFTDDVPDKVRSERDHGGWVIDDAGGVVGFAIMQRRGMSAAEILWAAVADRRGAGLGTQLVDHVLDEASAEGVQIVEVKTLDPSAGYAPYDAARAFRLARGVHSARHHRSASRPAAGQSGGDPRRRTRPDAIAAHRVPLTHPSTGHSSAAVRSVRKTRAYRRPLATADTREDARPRLAIAMRDFR